jgi:AcrR family transcriptional regulator
MRADAERNRERVVRAAAEVFAEKGLDAAAAEVAVRAGVGKATLYRNFPTKEHLIAAVAIERIHWFEGLLEDALREPDAWTALRDVFCASAEVQARDLAAAGAIAAALHLPEVQEARAAMNATLDKLLRRAQRQGAMRAGVRSADLRVLWGGVVHQLVAAGERDPRVWRRYALFVTDGLRR